MVHGAGRRGRHVGAVEVELLGAGGRDLGRRSHRNEVGPGLAGEIQRGRDVVGARLPVAGLDELGEAGAGESGHERDAGGYGDELAGPAPARARARARGGGGGGASRAARSAACRGRGRPRAPGSRRGCRGTGCNRHVIGEQPVGLGGVLARERAQHVAGQQLLDLLVVLGHTRPPDPRPCGASASPPGSWSSRCRAGSGARPRSPPGSCRRSTPSRAPVVVRGGAS